MASCGIDSVVSDTRLVGLYGGTFDPVHNGHIHVAKSVLAATALTEIRWVLSARPGHRAAPAVSIEDRWRMLTLMCDGYPEFHADDTEIHFDGPSYTFETVSKIGQEEGCAPCWIMGYDAFATLESWHKWSSLLQVCNFILVHRPGMQERLSRPLEKLLSEHEVTALQERIGQIKVLDVEMLDVSSTQIRKAIKAERNVEDLLAPPVYTYIKDMQLYTEKAY